jgi:hypothetical protein
VFELVAGVLLAAAAVYYVLRPILRPDLSEGSVAAELVDTDLEDDVSPRARALRALREIEFDRATGKLSDTDYESLRTKYTALALEALREAQEQPAERPGQPAPPARVVSATARPTCPDHGPRPERDAVFCSACGRRLGAAPGYCASCGTTLESNARFCSRCGTRVAA